MSKYTLAQILEAWEAAYGEDMHEEYPGFIQRLSEETDKETDWSTKHQAPSFKLDNCAQWDYKGCRKKEICKQ